MGEVKLYAFSISPFTRKVVIALKLKGIQCEYFEEDLNNKSPDLLRYNPVFKATPVLVHNGRPVCESLLIIEYLDETWKDSHPLMPQDPYERAMARFWAKFIDDKLVPSIKVAILRECEPHEYEIKMEEAFENLKILEKVLEGKKYFGGDKIGYLDIAAIYIIGWVPHMAAAAKREVFTRELFPHFSVWIDLMLSHSVIKDNLPASGPLLAYYEWRLERNAAVLEGRTPPPPPPAT
ncbi:hypothetical protein Nepgr_024902 [Nepenthes gracilis]|uniref:glutathione transferase n=1 Tax=Nepenthes gracilis TaxID=150966 RepID=A0AAD3T5Y7_NEPGR|nr:hypothetical protein Nepgr_024902 [Nepenthes gracilis]